MQVQVNRNDLKKASLMLLGIKNGSGQAMARAINRTLTTVRTDCVKEIRKDITPSAKVIRETFKLKKAFKTNPVGWLENKGKPLNLIHFRARQTQKGVSVQVKKHGKRTLIKHAFIADLGGGKVYKNDPRFQGTTSSNKGPQVYWRKYEGPRSAHKPGFPYGRLPLKYRFPVKNLTGPRVPDILGNPKVMGPIMKRAQEKFNQNFIHEVEFILSKL